MAVRNERYSREFTSRTRYHESGNHEFSETNPYQDMSEEDEELRDKIWKDYALTRKREGIEEIGQGFDGERHYRFNIKQTRPKEFRGYSQDNTKYKTTIEIRKAGSKRAVKNLSDLEKFLSNNGFEKE